MTQAEFMQDEIFKIKEKVIELSINDEKLMQEISSLNFSLTPNNIRNVRLTFEECKKNFAQLLIKNEKSINEQKIVDIKLFSRTISTSSSIEYGIYHDEDIKNILSAYNLLANENKERAFVGINISQEKIQYVIICGTSAKIKANELISKINSLVSGKGGGNNFSAQGGTTQVDSVKKIIDFLSNQ
jgi:alanyl-tRNA synthetase